MRRLPLRRAIQGVRATPPVDRQILLPVLLGLAGMAAAVVGAFFRQPTLGVLGGLAALGSATVSLSLVRQLHDAQRARGRLEAALAEHEPGPGNRMAAALLDRETGLPDEWFFQLVLEGRVAAARRQLHPLSVVLLDLAVDPRVTGAGTGTLDEFVGLVHRTLREADIVCRTGPSTFALILERTTEEGAIWAAERIQLALVQEAFSFRRVAAAVATYPIHGLSVEEILRLGRRALARAAAAPGASRLTPVEVARSDS